MQEGSFRCDANVSVRPKGQTELGTRSEVKNVNSFRFLERAILYEARRQIELIEDGGTVVQETRLYDRSEEHTSELQSLMRISYAVFCLKKKKTEKKRKKTEKQKKKENKRDNNTQKGT